MHRIKTLLLATVCCLFVPVSANEIGFEELFNLDRQKALKQLLPGTEQYYFYHCLHYQHTGKYDKVRKLLKKWSDDRGETSQVRQIRNRQALFDYNKDPKKTLEYIRDQLGLSFSHQRLQQMRKAEYPHILDQKLISRSVLKKQAFAYSSYNLGGFKNAALEFLIKEDLSTEHRRDLLRRLKRPDYPQLPSLVVAELKHRHSQGFGSLSIHRQMLLSQLDTCRKMYPKLLRNSNFINVYLSKLAPSTDVNWLHNDRAKEAYFKRLWQFVSKLEIAQNSLKAHVLYHRLAHDLNNGRYDKETFMRYLKLPRSVSYINREYYQDSTRNYYSARANLNANYRSYTKLNNIGNDEALVRNYLQHYFKTASGYDEFSKYVEEAYLKEIFATTKIVNGIGDIQKWYPLLSPEKYQSLKERIDLEFAPTNRQIFSSKDDVKLSLVIKNVKKLIIKTYHIHTLNYYRQHKKEVASSLDLDGLVANNEQVISYNHVPLRQHTENFTFSGIKKPGVYVVEFIGNGKSCRAIVKKGWLNVTERLGSAGHVFTVYNDNNKHAKNAKLWMSGREYKTDKEGQIAIPFTNRPRQQQVIISSGDFAALHSFYHYRENYSFQAGIYVNRESLIKGENCRVLVHPYLFVNSVPISVDLLEKVTLTIQTNNRNGISNTKEINDFKLHDNKESVYEFKVPDDLTSISFTLKAKIHNLSQNKKLDVRSYKSFSINGIDKLVRVEDIFLRHVRNRYLLEILGKTGEPKKQRVVTVTLTPRYFQKTVRVVLQSNVKGRILLGQLKDIDKIHVQISGSVSRQWFLAKDRRSYPPRIHSSVKSPIHIPAMGPVAKVTGAISLLEKRQGVFTRQVNHRVTYKNGFFVIAGLTAGNYDLWLKRPDVHIEICLTKGTKNNNYILSRDRYLEAHNQRSLHMQPITINKNKDIVIRLQNVTTSTRVHVIATNFVPDVEIFSALGLPAGVYPNKIAIQRELSYYLSGRDIGDEYRYILERKYAQKHPGNMLTRPRLLLNPWSLRKTDTGKDAAGPGTGWDDYSGDKGGRAYKPKPSPKIPSSRMSGTRRDSNIDFLAHPALILENLKPNKKGIVTLKLSAVSQRQQIHVVAMDRNNTVYREVALNKLAAKYRDLRLRRALPAKKHFSEQRNISTVLAGKVFNLEDITTSEMEIYDSLQRVYSLYNTLSNNSTLVEFNFILNWPKLKMERKLELYSQYACHELNFFLYKKDRPFFNKTVRPFIKNKKDKTFLDHWLLGENLAPFLGDRFYELNVVERILLGQKFAKRGKGVKRHITELHELLPPNVEKFNRWFDTALQTSSLEKDDRFDYEKAKEEAMPEPEPEEPAEEEMEEDTDEAFDDDDDDGVDFGEGAEDMPSAPKNGARFKDEKKRDSSRRQKLKQYYRQLDKTEEWVENNYYHLPIEKQNANLVKINSFWQDYATHKDKGPFLSTYAAEAANSFTEMMFALAVLDLPFDAPEHNITFTRARMTLSPKDSLIVFHKEIKKAEAADGPQSILISQSFFAHGDRYYYKNHERFDKFVTDEFIAGRVYGCHVVLTNPTSTRRKIDVLLQIPKGALFVLNGFYTKSRHYQLRAYSTQTFEYYFYFPRVGKYPHYPVHVAQNGKLIAFTKPFQFNVVEQPTKQDKASWQYISQYAKNADVLGFMRKNNLQRLKLDLIAFRMKNKTFYNNVLSLLRKNHCYNSTLWSYGVHHNDPAAIRDYLSRSSYANSCGMTINSDLLTVDPIIRHRYQHKEYWPLVNARTYQLGKKRKILNRQFFNQYNQFLRYMSYRPKMSTENLMTLMVYLLIQDRVVEAGGLLKRLEPKTTNMKMQYDYLAAYLAFSNEQPQKALAIAGKYKDYPVVRWRNMFNEVLGQADEIAGKGAKVVDKDDLKQTQTKLADKEPSFNFKIENRKIMLQYQNLQSCHINYYMMDIELLFSRNPFVQEVSGQFSIIRPNATQTVSLAKDSKKLELALPAKYHNHNVMVEVSTAGKTQSQAYYPHSLNVQMMTNYGQLRVTNEQTGKSLTKVYVKVYARMKNGNVQFYKDGYTDLRGRFDYASLSTDDLDRVSRFSILIMSEKDGAVIREVNPPKM